MNKAIIIMIFFFCYFPYNKPAICESISNKSEIHLSPLPPSKEEVRSSGIKEDKWFGWDKFGHFFISGFLSGSSYSIYHKSFNNDKESSIYFAGTFTLSLGVGKEINDMKKPQNKFSYKDLVCDLLGISIGLIIASD